MPVVRITYPGLPDVAPDAAELIALLIAVSAFAPDAGLTVIVCAPKAKGIVVKIRHVARNRGPSCLFIIVSPLDWIFVGLVFVGLEYSIPREVYFLQS